MVHDIVVHPPEYGTDVSSFQRPNGGRMHARTHAPWWPRIGLSAAPYDDVIESTIPTIGKRYCVRIVPCNRALLSIEMPKQCP